MTVGAQARLLPDGRRLHLQHGPIDIIAEAFGAMEEVRAAYAQAATRFQSVLEPLVEELAVLRRPAAEPRPLPRGPVARRMVAAIWPHRDVFVTPMIAVAGAVADEILEAMVAGRSLTRAYVNNGGDIAFHLEPGESLNAGVVNDQRAPNVDARVPLSASLPVRGLATSGWQGRSFSLGIADAVTVFARSAASADVAATLIANAVNVEHPAITRWPAHRLRRDSDLGDRLVTVDVDRLPADMVALALEAGGVAARRMRARGLIHGAYVAVQGEVRIVMPDEPSLSSLRSSA